MRVKKYLMITFIYLGKYGRMGNQLFQYAALRALSLKNGYEIKIPNPDFSTWHGQKCLLNNFNIGSSYLSNDDLEQIKHRYYEPDYMKFDLKFHELPDNIDLYGFFQSTLYFKEFEKEIIEELTPKQEFLKRAQDILRGIKEDNSGYEIVSLHLRRGDNTDGSNSNNELNEMYGKNGVLEMDSFYGKYLTAAKDYFKDRKVKFLIFSGGNRLIGNNNETDLEWCRYNFVGEEYLFAEPNDSMIDFCLIMSCDHNIISHISSFGWWAAYLNQNKRKIVVAPNKYHPDRPDFNHRQGFYPEGWTIV